MPLPSITLFPDTNLFVQCNELRSLDWTVFGSFQEIRLIVARPVQKEIDRQKGGGNGRIARRARRASGLFAEIIAASLTPIIIREAGPRVTLALGMPMKPSPSLADTLDYGEPDDVLVGIAHAYASAMSGEDVAVLSHDTGVMASAVTTGAKHLCIPDAWLLGPEDTKAEKELKVAQTEIARLRSSEPQITVECLDEDGNALEEIHLEYPRIKALTDAEIERLLDYARHRFPMKEDFAAKPAPPRRAGVTGISLDRYAGMPPAEDQIAEYHAAYRAWEKALHVALKSIHRIHAHERASLPFRFRAQNRGTRPATDVLIEMKAYGAFWIRRPDDSDREDEKAALPAPPEPPVAFRFNALDAVREFGRLSGNNRLFGLDNGFAPSLLAHIPERDDPDAFYYKGRLSRAPSEILRLECERWRHNLEAKAFFGEIELPGETDTHGSIEFRVHASNLTNSAGIVVPVAVQMVEFDTFGQTKAFIDALKLAPLKG